MNSRNIDLLHRVQVITDRLSGWEGGNGEHLMYKRNREYFNKRENKSSGFSVTEFDVTKFFYVTYKPEFWYV